MKVYARIEHGCVIELLATEGDIAAMFHQDLHWIDVTDKTKIARGWRYDGLHFIEPPYVVSTTTAPTVLESFAVEPSSGKTTICAELDPR